ncbi:MAG TPA: LpqB family beta-propeller domain-containing protein [Mycobacteriales bacterium]|nr:LpqB family beta-propeller domain-containing protein [Mycobacteriales bacterium]
MSRPRTRPSRAARWAAGLVALLALVGCSAIPRSGEVTAVRPVVAPDDRADSDRGPRNGAVSVRFPPPASGASPEQIVRGFFNAHADLEPELQVARQYLAPSAVWDARAGATVYGGERTIVVVDGGDSEKRATVSFARAATVSRRGEYQPVRDPALTVFQVGVRIINGQWRVFDVPDGLLLSETGLERALRRSVLYFPDPTRSRLVPDPIFLPRGEASAATSVARALLEGPSSWLAPAVRTAVPRDTTLTGSVTVLAGMATLNLSRELQAVTREARDALVAQLVWTLTEEGMGIDRVRLLVDGRDFVLSGGDPRRGQTRADVAAFDPDPASNGRLYFLRAGVLHSLDGGEAVRLRTEPRELTALAVSRSAALIAVVRRNRDGADSLLVGALSGDLPTRLVGPRISSPTWEAGGERAWVLRETSRGAELLSVPVTEGPGVQRVRVGAGPGVLESVALSPDGTRIAVVLRRAATRTAWVGRVERARGEVAVAGFRAVRPGLAGVSGISWETSTRLVVAAAAAISRVEVDGFGFAPVPVDGLPASPVGRVVGGSAVDLVAEVSGRLWRRNAGWQLIGVGISPAYAS